MSLNIKNLATVALADELARRQGVSKTAAIHQALSERLRRLGYGDNAQERLLGELRAISERVARLPELVARDDEEIVGYDEHGIPT
jgi:antitoxin VapB